MCLLHFSTLRLGVTSDIMRKERRESVVYGGKRQTAASGGGAGLGDKSDHLAMIGNGNG